MDNEASATLAVNNPKKAAGLAPKRNRGGRPKGSPNKITADIKAAIMAAFGDVGGKDYLRSLATSDARTFCALLGKILPTEVAGDAEDGPVRIEYSWLPPQSCRS